MNDIRKKLGLTACWGILLASCADGGSVYPEMDIQQPLVVKAEIDGFSGLATRAVATDNGYDRSSFIDGDVIRIVRTKSGATNALNYTLSGSAWGPSDADSYFKFESAATYQASYPSNYTSIRPDQSTAEAYRLSNLLQTPSVSVTRLGVVAFTDTDAFTHKNVKVTINFVGSNTLSFSSVTVQAPGLYSGGTTAETVYFLRPNASGYTWQAIVYPKGSATSISVSFTDSNGVTYKKTDLSCGMVAGNNYIYTLTIRNNILIAVGTEIKAWQDESAYVGKFD